MVPTPPPEAEPQTSAEAQAHAESFPIHTITPHIEERDGEQWLMIPEGVGYPVLGQSLSTAKRA